MLNEIKELNSKGEDALGMGAELYMKFSKFHGDYLLHTVDEETDTQHLLWENFTDPELHTIRGKIIAGFTPDAFEKWQSYIMPSITQSDIVMMMGGMRTAAPEQFTKLMAMAEKYLPADEFSAIKDKLK